MRDQTTGTQCPAIFDFPGRFVNDYLDPEAKGVERTAWEVVTAGETRDCPITIVC